MLLNRFYSGIQGKGSLMFGRSMTSSVVPTKTTRRPHLLPSFDTLSPEKGFVFSTPNYFDPLIGRNWF